MNLAEHQLGQLEHVVDSLRQLPDALRQAITDRLWADIPVTVDEFAGDLTATGAETLTPAPATANLELVTFIAAVVPAGHTGTLLLGNVFQFPLPPGVTILWGLRVLLGPGDRRQLVIS